jgi:RNA polymerase sigma-70 factor (ECF subfamily)
VEQNLSDNEIIEGLRSGRDDLLVELYRKYRSSFVYWIQGNYGLDRPMAADCFQDAVIAFYNNIVEGKIERLESSLKTYLYAIARNIARKKLIKKDREVPWPEAHMESVSIGISSPEALYIGNERVNTIAGMVESISEPCRSILRYFYYKGFSMEAIASVMQYKNADTVKAQKVRCIKELKLKARDFDF